MIADLFAYYFSEIDGVIHLAVIVEGFSSLPAPVDEPPLAI